MKRLLLASVMLVPTATLGVASPDGNLAAARLNAQERCVLSANSDDSLLNLRAGAAQDSANLSGVDRELLARAQDNAPDLAALRGGEAVVVSDHDLIIIGVVLLALILIVAL
jgi:hypothetical protein